MEVIKIENLRFNRGKFNLSVDNFSVRQGERTALMGLNGSGKSTLFQLIAGLYSYGGSIKIYGEEVRQFKKAQLGRKVAMSFQNPDHNIITSLVQDEILFASRNYFPERSDKEVLSYVLDYFPIEHLLEKSTQELSYGEKRLVGLAVSIAHRPDVILLDEPFTMLDYKQKNNLIAFIRTMPAKAICIATHETELLADICEQVCILDGGSLVQKGGKELLMRQV